MTKTPEQIKNIVEGWIKTTNAKFEDITQSEKPKQPRLQWAYKIGKDLIVFMMEGRGDRFTIESPITFAPEHQKASSELSDKDFLKFLIYLLEPIYLADLNPIVLQENKIIKNISIQSYIDTDSPLEREKFFRICDKIAGFREITIKKVQVEFGVKGKLTDTKPSDSSETMYG